MIKNVDDNGLTRKLDLRIPEKDFHQIVVCGDEVRVQHVGRLVIGVLVRTPVVQLDRIKRFENKLNKFHL
jgi:hypothetical protein